MGGWLPPPQAPTLVLADLTDENVLLAETDGVWGLAGVLDFAGAFAGDGPLELVSPGVFFVQGVPGRLRALLQGAGLPGTPEERLAWHLLHPYSILPRDLTMCGWPPETPVAAATGLWRTAG